MSKQKSKRNQKILAAFNKDESVYAIAKRFNLSWSRTKRIIQQEQLRHG